MIAHSWPLAKVCHRICPTYHQEHLCPMFVCTALSAALSTSALVNVVLFFTRQFASA